MTFYYAIEPLEPITFRGNRNFGSSADHGGSAMPPWPSVFAGALRSAILGHNPVALAAYNNRRFELPGEIGRVLGTPYAPGTFRIVWASLAQKKDGHWSPVLPTPADLILPRKQKLRFLKPAPLPPTLQASSMLPMLALDCAEQESKPETGRWLDGEDLTRYLRAEVPQGPLSVGTLMETRTRIGIELDSARRTAAEGKLYSTDVVSLRMGSGFLVGCDGFDTPDASRLLPDQGTLRLGGDGRAAQYHRVLSWNPPALLDPIRQDGQFRLVLTSPGIFQQGWLPDRVVSTSGGYQLQLHGFSARLASAAVARHQIVSGWDLAYWKPKPTFRAAPAGSVYWFDQLQGDPCKLAEWVATGLWDDNPDRQRQAEGFNRAMLAAWPSSEGE